MELVLGALKKHWSALVVALLVGFYSVRLWPASSEGRAQPVAGVLQPTVERPAVDPALVPREKVKAEQQQSEGEGEKAKTRSKKEIELREKPIFVEAPKTQERARRTFNSDSPEVKRALSELEIEVFAAQDSEEAQELGRLLEDNDIPFARKDTSDPMQKERARRISGRSEGTVIVVDDQVLLRYSSKSMQEALARAVQNRLEE